MEVIIFFKITLQGNVARALSLIPVKTIILKFLIGDIKQIFIKNEGGYAGYKFLYFRKE